MILEPFLAVTLPTAPEVFVGAMPGRQCLDIVFAMQSVIEKGLDDHGKGAVAQRDIHQLYTAVPLPTVFLKHSADSQPAPIRQRTIGGLTGSSVAGCMARIPIETAMKDCNAVWQKWGHTLGDKVLCVASCVEY